MLKVMACLEDIDERAIPTRGLELLGAERELETSLIHVVDRGEISQLAEAQAEDGQGSPHMDTAGSAPVGVPAAPIAGAAPVADAQSATPDAATASTASQQQRADEPWRDEDRLTEQTRQIAFDRLAAIARKHSFQGETVVAVAESPAEAIVEEAEERGVDVIVMSTQARGALGEAIFGSTAKDVLQRSSVPVLMVPPTADAPS